MSSLKPLEILTLWNLASCGGGQWNTDLKPVLTAHSREKLRALGLLTAQKQNCEKLGRISSILYLSLTEAGWAALNRPNETPLVCRTHSGSEILGRLALTLTKFLSQSQLNLATIFQSAPTAPTWPVKSPIPLCPEKIAEPKKRAKPPKRAEPAKISPPQLGSGSFRLNLSDIERRLKTLAQTKAQPGGGLKLADLRPSFADYPRLALDKALLALQKENALVLFEMVDPLAIAPEDHEAALVLEGVAFHLLYLNG
ncbi:MAG: hypothetical protein LBT38_12615 [Deltaproteobacteria bacterium]|jgi:hypothetical protein|nr:hypothetical protein [Deltaproteobacteria bacterium]